ncbi:TonB-dependent receptor [Asticcacaulis sp.]|uniref:TonB-dependent receptor n=1 Tax=Asticcacaulis sp. TaxID=1872648 RepID=UPI003F7BF797
MTDRSSVAHCGQKSIHKFGLTLASSVLALGFATTVFAQDAAPAAPAAAPVDDTVVIVKGVRASITKSLAVKRRATQVVDSIVAEDIGKLPDNNVVDALQRVTGVQVTGRTGGEATAISIRGLPDIATTWNGRNVFTASGRQFALQDIPANLVRQIDVYKTRAADQLETGLAGQVDVATLRPFDFKGPEISVAARGIYIEPAKEFNPNISILASNRWQTGAGEVGALVNLSYARTKYADQSVTAGALVPFLTETNIPAGWVPLERIFNTDGRASENPIWTPGLYPGLPSAAGSTLNINGQAYPYYLSRDAIFQNELQGDRERPSAVAAFQWQPNADAVYTAEFFYDGYRNSTFNNLFFSFVDWWGNPGAVTTYPGTNILKTRTVDNVYGFNSGDMTVASTDSYVYALNGKWNVGENLQLVGDLSYQKSVFKSAFMAQRTDRVHSQINVDFNRGDGITEFNFADMAALTDPTAWNVAQFYDNGNRNFGEALTGQLDGDYTPDNWGPVKKFSFGVRWDDRKANEANRTQSSFLGRPLSAMDAGFSYYNSDFFSRADVPHEWVVANGYYIADHIDDIRDLYHSVDANFLTTDQLSLFRTFQVEEKTGSAYAQVDLENQVFGRRLRSEFGLRYVDVTTDMTFFDKATGDVGHDTKSIAKVLPSMTLRYDATDEFTLRFNYGETLRRPDFTALNPILNLAGDITNVGIGGGSGGNPNLRPTHAKNTDLTAEWYFSRGSAIYGTLFRRQIDGLVVPFFYTVNVPDADPALNATTFRVSAPVNASDGVLEGMELGLTYFPENLPGILDGFGVQTSITYLDSKQNVPVEGTDADHITKSLNTQFFGVSPLSYNATLAYERGPVGARLSYVWRKNFLDHNEASIFANPLGVWKRPEKSLDFQINYDITDKMSVSLDATNITDELSQSYYYFGGAGGQDTDNFGSSILGRTIAIGFRWKY